MVSGMRPAWLIEKLRRTLRKFRRAEGGNVIVTFTLALVPIMGFVGAAVDYSHGNSVKAAMQAALDATALAMSKSAASMTSTDLQQKSAAYFTALFNKPEATNVQITATYNPTGGTLVVNGTALMNTSFMAIMGFPQLTITGNATAAWGMSRLRVALVLDNTGSMAQSGKMTALKTAAKNLLTQLQSAATQNGDVYVSIIPFAEDVNVDPVNYSQTWIRWDLWDALNGTCSNNNYTNKTDCLAHNKTWTPKNHNTWDGCVTDRDQNYDTTNTAPVVGQTATLFPAEQYVFNFFGMNMDWCPVPMMGLSYDWLALKNKIDAMQPTGFTNQAIGLQWGWQSLTSAPFTIPAMDSNYKYSQVIVLFTDGLNTSDRWYPYGVSTSEASIDARQAITCANIKAAGITIYAVQISTDGEPQSTLLRNCASDTSKFFFLTAANDLITIFNQIGSNLSQLRIAK
jgi:Flp pilus assembly protein TadG